MHQVFIRFVGARRWPPPRSLAPAQTPSVSWSSHAPGARRGATVSGAAAAASGAASCRQTRRYSETTWISAPTGIRLGTSGAEITKAHTWQPPVAEGFHRLTHTILEANGKPDCGRSARQDRRLTVVRFIQFSPRKTCSSSASKRVWRSVTAPFANRRIQA
jgi:hypothetical protein